MNTDEYEAIPEAEWKVLATTEITHLTDEEKDYLPHAWDEWIARVRRDAKAEAWAEGMRYAILCGNETSDSWGNLYRMDWIDRMEHEIEENPYLDDEETTR